ncbi:carboxymuconolactone decarboxylase family protein [Spongiibacter marinus]|uniref:carboxymuconolactone decarboxylase family protein n=1 Tax=Spongiibacter marinus TaxID=354246 RepID=UPI0003FE7AF0|nr:carboxymuconolactone decarboxylase family protein [Spongiibacter marinus]
MTKFTFHTASSAPEASKPFIDIATSAYGFLPNLLAGMAEVPALLEGYITLSAIFDKTALNETERQIILMTNNRLNGCTYCMAAHTSISQAAGVAPDIIQALRDGSPISQPKYEALRQYTIAVIESRGWVQATDLNALLSAGYSKQTALEVILGTSLKTMSNFTNHIAQTPVDKAFMVNAWSDDATQAR